MSCQAGQIFLLARPTVSDLRKMYGRAGRDPDRDPCHPHLGTSFRSGRGPADDSHGR